MVGDVVGGGGRLVVVGVVGRWVVMGTLSSAFFSAGVTSMGGPLGMGFVLLELTLVPGTGGEAVVVFLPRSSRIHLGGCGCLPPLL